MPSPLGLRVRADLLTMALGVVHMLYGAQRAGGGAFETYRFSDVLALDASYQALFGLLQLALGGLMVLGRDPVSALVLGAMLNLALFVASTGVDGAEPKRAAVHAVGWLVLHFAAAMLESNSVPGATVVRGGAANGGDQHAVAAMPRRRRRSNT